MPNFNSEPYKCSRYNMAVEMKNECYYYNINFDYRGYHNVFCIKQDNAKIPELFVLVVDMADKLSKEEFEIFNRHVRNFIVINDSDIVINNKVYVPEKNEDYDWLMLYTGNSNLPILNKDKHGQNINIDAFNSKVKSYCRKNNVMPEDKYLSLNKTEKLIKALECFKENDIDTEIFYKVNLY